IEFKFNILQNLDSSLWDVDNPLDWIFNLPNPRIYQIDFRISSNVSIQDTTNLTHAMLEIYNGGNFTPFIGLEWLQFSDNKTFADIGENTKILPFDSYYTWYVMHLLNESKDNSLRVRLRFIGNGTFKGINISIDEFTLNFHLQNAISSDVTSKIGFGINSNTLKAPQIQLKNFGIGVSDNGLWETDISNGVPVQGFFYFNVTSIWPEVRFDVSGNYTIENLQIFNWEYYLGSGESRILWNASTDITYYSFYNNLDYSQGLQFNIPSEWLLMDIYNSSSSPANPNGGWYPSIESNVPFKFITVYNISDGSWKIGLNSSKNLLLLSTNSTDNVYIDKVINVNLQVQDYFGGTVTLEVYNEDVEIIYSESSVLDELANESSESYIWDIFSTTKTPGTYYLKAYWILYNDTHAFLSINTTEILISKYTVNLEILNIDQFSNSPQIYGTKILIEGKLTFYESGIVIGSQPIIAEIKDSNQDLIESLSDNTDSGGIIQIEYSLPSGYSGISIQLLYNASETYYSQNASIQSIELKLISQVEYNINIFMSFLPYIGAVLGIMVFTVGAMKYRKGKQRKIWAEDATVLDDLVKISYIMVISKEVGVSIYHKQISFEDIDSD
ncbi:hypothetical protein LCGC14_2223930, partial [marine sediment metagenome]